MIRIDKRAAALAALLFATVPALAQTPSIEVRNPWSRAALAGRTGVVFLTIASQGAPDRLIAVTSPVAEAAQLHVTTMDQGVMKMRSVAALTVEPGKPVILAPGGNHIMLMHLKQALNEGDRVPVTLTFEKAGPISVTAAVAEAGGGMPAPVR